MWAAIFQENFAPSPHFESEDAIVVPVARERVPMLADVEIKYRFRVCNELDRPAIKSFAVG
jgi:hypothetical protein